MIAQFAIRLICGMSLTWCLMPRRDVSDGFFRIQMLIVMGLSVLATLVSLGGWDASFQATTGGLDSLSGPQLDSWLYGTTAVLAYLGSFTWALGRRRAGTVCIALICGLSLLLLIAWAAAASAGAGRFFVFLDMLGYGCSSLLVRARAWWRGVRVRPRIPRRARWPA